MKRHFLLAAVAAFAIACQQVPTTPEEPVVIQPVPQAPKEPTSAQVQKIKDIAAGSQCAAYAWKDRGRAPKAYMRGMALTFAKAICNPTRADVVLVSKAATTDTVKDALAHYAPEFAALSMKNDKDSQRTLRHVYLLAIGLGMRESSGRHCCGRDMSADFSSENSAEAGTFQASYGSKRSSDVLVPMFQKYLKSRAGCFAETFKEGVTCTAANWKNWGVETSEGYKWQQVTKECPAFSAEWATVLIRKTGGTKGEFGPLRQKKAELRTECNTMLDQVQTYVTENPEVCKLL